MIIFLNFAPFEFMGGAEKWMVQTALKANKREDCLLIDVSPKIANIYGRLILNRSFSKHGENKELDALQKIDLTLLSFIPFTSQWLEVKDYFKNARIIYIRFEILELIICLYFGGNKIINKVIAGIILTPKYLETKTFFQKLHNFIYNSDFYLYYLKRACRVHVLNKRDYTYYKNILGLRDVEYVPPSVPIPTISKLPQIASNELNIIYVGEISQRKGLDTIIEIIKIAPKSFIFNIVGDGPMKKDLISISASYKNCRYFGYVNNQKLQDLFEKSEVILFPSRGESFGMAMVEAAAYGSKIINSSEVSLKLPSYVEESVVGRNPLDYMKVLINLFRSRTKRKFSTKIRKYVKEHFSEEVINRNFQERLLGIT